MLILRARRATRAHRQGSSRVLLAGLLLAGLVACSDDDERDSSPASDASASPPSVSVDVDEVQSRYEAIAAGTNQDPPAGGPEATSGKSVWIISCGQVAEGCAMFSSAQEEAAQAIGWDVTVVDGAFSPNTESDGIRQAMAAGADAIVLASIQCDTISAALGEAIDAGIAVVGAPDFGCGVDPSESDLERLLTTWVVPSETYGSFTELVKAQGAGRALYLAANQPDARIINVHHVNRLGQALDRGFREELEASCPGCEIVADVEVSDADIPSGGFGSKTAAALLEHPDADAIVVPFDLVLNLGAGQAIAQDGRELTVIGGEGSGSGMQGIRDGSVTVEVAVPWQWAGWAAIDSLNRHFNDEDPVAAGIGIQAVTIDMGLPDGEQPYQSEVDFRSLYRALWGV